MLIAEKQIKIDANNFKFGNGSLRDILFWIVMAFVVVAMPFMFFTEKIEEEIRRWKKLRRERKLASENEIHDMLDCANHELKVEGLPPDDKKTVD